MVLQSNCSESCYRIDVSSLNSSELQEMVLKAVDQLHQMYFEDEPIKAHLNQVIKKKEKEVIAGDVFEFDKTIAFICSRFEGGPGDFVMDLNKEVIKYVYSTSEIHDLEDRKLKPKLE